MGLALPVITNQKMNHYLKDICELCGFTDPVTIVCYRAGQRVEGTYPKWAFREGYTGNSADSTVNPVFLQIQKYISPEHKHPEKCVPAK